jgi:hypothetical protein
VTIDVQVNSETLATAWAGSFSTNVNVLAHRIALEAAETFRMLELAGEAADVQIDAIKMLIALKYINTVVSAPLRMFAPVTIANEYDGQDILHNGVGICGQQVEAMMALCDALGLTSRMVQMSWDHHGNAASHVTCEVKIAEKWCYLDVSFGSMMSEKGNIYKLSSLEDIIAQTKQLNLLESNWDPWRHQWIMNYGDPITGLQQAQDWDVTFDGSGTGYIPFENDVGQFAARQNFIGMHARNQGRFGNYAMAFDMPEGHDLEVEFGEASFYTGKTGTLIARDNEGIIAQYLVSSDLGKITFKQPQGCLHLSILCLDVCTLMIRSVRRVLATS